VALWHKRRASDSYPVYTIKQTSSRHRANVEQTSSQLIEPASLCKWRITVEKFLFLWCRHHSSNLLWKSVWYPGT